jgi:hypothetical protein
MKPNEKIFFQALTILSGLIVTWAAIFARGLGPDANSQWGPRRIIFFLASLSIILLSSKIAEAISKLMDIFTNRIAASPRNNRLISEIGRLYLPAFLLFSLIVIVFVWFITFGTWTRLPSNASAYYNSLSAAFSHGRLFLDLQPSQALLSLPNPYDPAARAEDSAPVDVTLYGGRFYLYFGPVPALVILPVKLLFHANIRDGLISDAAMLGILIVQLLLIMNLWKHFFQDLPSWIVLITIPLASLISPFIWMVESPKIYHAAIASGQFFFIAGLYALALAWESDFRSAVKLILAGIFFILSIGSRLIHALPVAFVVMLALARIFIKQKRFTDLIRPLLATGIPLASGMALLAWYNWARFGSPLEFGFRYAITGNDLLKYSSQLFSPAYIPSNLYNYLIIPWKLITSFPFIEPTAGIKAPAPFLSRFYRQLSATGILFTSPFNIIYALAGIIIAAKSFPLLFQRKSRDENGSQKELTWLLLVLCGTVILALGQLALFFSSSIRYEMDFMPALTLLAVLGFWQGYEALRSKPSARYFYSAIGVGLAFLSILMSVLLAFNRIPI